MSKHNIDWLFERKSKPIRIFIDGDHVLLGHDLKRHYKNPKLGVLRCPSSGPTRWEVKKENMERFLTDLKQYADACGSFHDVIRTGRNLEHLGNLQRIWLDRKCEFDSLYKGIIDALIIIPQGPIGSIARPPHYNPIFFKTKEGQPYFWKFVTLYNDVNFVPDAEGVRGLQAITPKEEQQIIKLLDEGMPQAEIARKVRPTECQGGIPEELKQAIYRINKDLYNLPK